MAAHLSPVPDHHAFVTSYGMLTPSWNPTLNPARYPKTRATRNNTTRRTQFRSLIPFTSRLHRMPAFSVPTVKGSLHKSNA